MPGDVMMPAAGEPYDLLLRNAVLREGAHVDIGIRHGLIVDQAPELPGPAREILQLEGLVVLPGLVEPHTHLDKALTLREVENRSGTLYEAMDRMHEMQRTFSVRPVQERARRAAQLFLAAGITTVRSHVDVTTMANLVAVEALLAVREEMRGLLDIQLVALCSGLLRDGARMREMVEEALRLGVDAVGGAPVLDTDPKAHIDCVFALAERYDRMVDLHIDECDDPRGFCLPYLAEKTIASGFAGRVVAGHCCSLAAVDDTVAQATIERVHEAGIAVVTLPSANMYLQGRGDRGIIRRGVTRVRELLDGGVPVCCGSDNVQDPFNPFGRGDLLLVANLLAHVAHLGSPTEQAAVLDAITTAPARALGLTRYGLQPGCSADLVVLDAHDPLTLLAMVPPRRYVIKGGHVVAETRTDLRIAACAPTAARSGDCM